MRVKTWFVLAGVLVLGGCGAIVTDPSDILARDWQLVSLQREGAAEAVPSDPSRYTLRLEEDGRARVQSDCNSCGGTYTLEGLTLDIAPLVCTRVGCPAGSLDPEFARASEGMKSVALTGSSLTLRGDRVTLRFSAR